MCDLNSFVEWRTFVRSEALALAVCGLMAILPKIVDAQESVSPQLKMLEHRCVTEKEDSFAEEVSIASDGEGNAWMVWLEIKNNGKEIIVVKENDKKGRSSPDGYYDYPQVACSKGGRPMIVWVRNVGDSWEIESCGVELGGFSKPVQVTNETDGRASYPSLAAGGKEVFWLVWEAYKDGNFQIYLKGYSDGKWGEGIAITDGAKNAYDPAVAVDSTGKVWITYSKAENGEKNIYLSNYTPGKLQVGKEIAVCISNVQTYQCGHPTVICDSKDRIWVAWERRSARKGSKSSFGRSECLVACYDNGRLKTVKSGIENYGGNKVFAASNNQLPEFLMGADGSLWLFSREILGPDIKNRRTWKIVASMLDEGRGWTPSMDVLDKVRFGRLQRPAITLIETNSMLVAWQGDNILESKKSIYSNIYMAKTEFPWSSGNIEKVDLEPYNCGEHSTVVLGRPWVKRREIIRNGQTYTLLVGNLHEHTNISRCHGDGSDGSIDDNYRYGIDVEGYDFLALTDHGYDVNAVNWRKLRRAARFYTDSPHFVGLTAYEWTFTNFTTNWMPGAGHRNIIFAKDKDAANFIDLETHHIYDSHSDKSNSPEKLWKLLREKNIKAVTIPHHPVNKVHTMDWDHHDPEYQSVVEIFQVSGSHEHADCPRATKDPTEHKGCFVQDALARGYKLGFIASGDHSFMGVGLAVVLVKEVSPEGIVDALRDRRCYATTGDKIFIDFSINDHVMGSEVKTDGKPRIMATIDGTDGLANVVVFRDGKIIHELKSEQLMGQKHYELDFIDDGFVDSSYYYLRLIQQNDEIGWSSPIWVDKK